MKISLVNCFAILALSAVMHAQADVPAWLKLPPQADQVQSSQKTVPDYRLALSSVIRINGLLRLEKDAELKGQLSRMTWQLPSDFATGELMRRVHDQLSRAQAVFLFQCQGRACGASNIWANDLFSTSRLYGIDETQSYVAARIDGTYYAIYLVRRGNQRIYLHIDQIDVTDKSMMGWQSLLEQQGWAEVPSWPDEAERSAEELLALMKDQSDLRIRLVLYQAGEDTDMTLDQSAALAKKLKQTLVDEGIESRRIATYGVGALVPQVLGARQQLLVVIAVTD